MNIPESIQRRDFLKQLGLASTAALATNGTQAWGNEDIIHPAAKADSCILIWMAGGMAAPDTFDPKRYHPFEKGLELGFLEPLTGIAPLEARKWRGLCIARLSFIR